MTLKLFCWNIYLDDILAYSPVQISSLSIYFEFYCRCWILMHIFWWTKNCGQKWHWVISFVAWECTSVFQSFILRVRSHLSLIGQETNIHLVSLMTCFELQGSLVYCPIASNMLRTNTFICFQWQSYPFIKYRFALCSLLPQSWKM